MSKPDRVAAGSIVVDVVLLTTVIAVMEKRPLSQGEVHGSVDIHGHGVVPVKQTKLV